MLKFIIVGWLDSVAIEVQDGGIWESHQDGRMGGNDKLSLCETISLMAAMSAIWRMGESGTSGSSSRYRPIGYKA